MERVRVWELARWADMDSAVALRVLERLGHDATTPLSTVTEVAAERFANYVQAERTGQGLAKIRVHELARELGMSSFATSLLLQDLGVPVASHMSSIHDFDADRLRAHLGARVNGRPWSMASLRPVRGPAHTPTPTPAANGSSGDGPEPATGEDDRHGRVTAEPGGTRPATNDAGGPGDPGEDAVADPWDTWPTPSLGDRALLLRMAREVKPHWRGLAAVLGLHLLATPLMLLQPVPLKIAVDSVLGDSPVPGLLAAAVPDTLTASPLRLLLLVALLHVLLMGLIQLQSMGTYVATTSTGEKITLGFRARLFRHAQRLSLAFHDRRGTYESLYRIEYDAQSLQHTADTVIPFVSSGLTLVVILFVTSRIDLGLALIALAVCPVLFWLSRQHIREIRGGYQELRELETSALGVVQEVLSAVRVVKAFGREDSEEHRFTRRYGASMQAKIELAMREGSYGLWINVTTAVGTALVLVVGVRNVLAGHTTLGELLMVIAYLASLYGPLEEIAQRVGDLQSSLAGAERAFQLLDEHPEVATHADAIPLGATRGELAFRGVTFGYDPGRPVLSNVNLRIEAGARLGIVGRTGAGKTTLISLIMRFYDPDEGTIHIDGHDLRDCDLASLRSQFALMLQEPVLFSTSIAENIRYARPDATDEEVRAAAGAADANDFILRLPEGYDTRVGERGMLLSGGERQRVSLARAFLRDAPILILDEPTSAVDHATEGAILEAMERLMAGRTTLMIAHRRSTLDDCDGIIEVADGTVRLLSLRGKDGRLRPPEEVIDLTEVELAETPG